MLAGTSPKTNTPAHVRIRYFPDSPKEKCNIPPHVTCQFAKLNLCMYPVHFRGGRLADKLYQSPKIDMISMKASVPGPGEAWNPLLVSITDNKKRLQKHAKAP